MICFSVFFFLLHSSALYEAASYREGIIITTHTLWGSHFLSLCCTHKVWRYLLTLWTLRSLVYCKQNEQKDSLCAADAFLKKSTVLCARSPIHRARIKRNNPNFFMVTPQKGEDEAEATVGLQTLRGVCVCVCTEREANMIDCASVTACVQCHPLLFWSAESWMWIPRASCSSQACLPFVAPMRQWRADESDRQRNREPPRTTQTKASRASGFQNGCAKRRCHRVSPLLRVGATRAIRVICESVCKKRLSR